MKVYVSALMAVFSALCAPAFSENAPMPPNVLSPNRNMHALVIGPADSLATPKNVAGNLILMSNIPKDIQAAEVEIFVDDKSFGTANAKPYKVEIDCSKYAAGEHIIKAVAKDSSSEQVWSASTKVRIGGSTSEPAPPAPAYDWPSNSDSVVTPSESVSQERSIDPNATYKSEKHGFTIRYPEGWAVNDETAKMSGKKSSDDLWLVIGAPPIVINIHCQELAPGTNAEVFARYNPYVQKWERRAVAGSPAFVTTDGKPDLGRVVHRIIFIKNGSAWMANCIDTTGKPSEQSAKLLEDMLETIELIGPQVNITPIK